jgi:glycosyltransferase involved in cell wall biosynthesis
MRIIFLPKYSRLGGSSRYMIYDYLEHFREAGIETHVQPLFDERYHHGIGDLARPMGAWRTLKHAPYFLLRIAERLGAVLHSPRYDVVVLEKELFPNLPFGLEPLLKRGGTRLVSFYDDAVHASYRYHPNRIVRLLCRRKVDRIMRLSDRVVTWNADLGGYARRWNPRVTTVNTGVDLRRYRPKDYAAPRTAGPLVIGWIGTPSSYPHIQALESVLEELAARHPVLLRVVSSEDYVSRTIRVDNRRWSLETEVDDLCSFDIGIMPLPDNEWTRGKSGCKAVQYMAVGIPAVSSPVGASAKIIRDGVNGFLAATPEAWLARLSQLIEDPLLRQQLGQAGRALVEQTYSIQAVAPPLIQALKGSSGSELKIHAH